MAQALVKTVQYVDPRIEPPEDPLYKCVIGPTQNQYYRIAAASKNNSTIIFNNLTTLGVDRAYQNTFEVEITCDFLFHCTHIDYTAKNDDSMWTQTAFPFNQITFTSFPLHKCTQSITVNLNGNGFYSEPMYYLSLKERYMDPKVLAECYEGVCPNIRPFQQYETGRNYSGTRMYQHEKETRVQKPNRFQPNNSGYGDNWMDSWNNSIIRLGRKLGKVANRAAEYENITFRRIDNTHTDVTIRVTWREPIMCSPFSAKYDANYGEPIYDVTSLDITYNLCPNLGNMIRVFNYPIPTPPPAEDYNTFRIASYETTLQNAVLCYQVMTIPSSIEKPISTLVPYRRFVPYITQYSANGLGIGGVSQLTQEGTFGGEPIRITSGVYTLNEIPTAIWVACAPSKARYQMNEPDMYTARIVDSGHWHDPDESGSFANTAPVPNWDSNKLFGFIQNLSITMANTTQILNTARPIDLFRIAKANGCTDSARSWLYYDGINPTADRDLSRGDGQEQQSYTQPELFYENDFYGAGSVLRLIPGVDLIVPDQSLIPGANANNMVIQVEGTFHIPPHSASQNDYALWLILEYVGVAQISPGQCEISMNPLGSGEIMGVSPILSAKAAATSSKLEGGSLWDILRLGGKALGGLLKKTQFISKTLGKAKSPFIQKIGKFAASAGYGEAGMKRARCDDDSGGAIVGGALRGGAVMGKGLNDWV